MKNNTLATNRSQLATFISNYSDQGVIIVDQGFIGVSAKVMAGLVGKDIRDVHAMGKTTWGYINALAWASKKAMRKTVNSALNDVALKFVASWDKLSHTESVALVSRELNNIAQKAVELTQMYEVHQSVIHSYGFDTDLNPLQIEIPLLPEDDMGEQHYDVINDDDFDAADRWLMEQDALARVMEQKELRTPKEANGFANESNTRKAYATVSADEWVAHYLLKDKAWWKQQAHFGVFALCTRNWSVDYLAEQVFANKLLTNFDGDVRFAKTAFGNYRKVDRLYTKELARLAGLQIKKESVLDRMPQDMGYDIHSRSVVDNTTVGAMQASKLQDQIDELNDYIRESELVLAHTEVIRNKYKAMSRFVQFETPLSDYAHYLDFDPVAFSAVLLKLKNQQTGVRSLPSKVFKAAHAAIEDVLKGGHIKINPIDIPVKRNGTVLAKGFEPVVKTIFQIEVFGTQNEDNLIEFARAMSGLSWKYRTFHNQDRKGAALEASLSRAKMVNKAVADSITTDTEIRTEDLIFG